MSVTEAFGDVAACLAQMAPDKIIGLKASSETSEWVEILITRKKDGSLTSDERFELERFLALDLFIGLVKARAQTLLKAT